MKCNETGYLLEHARATLFSGLEKANDEAAQVLLEAIDRGCVGPELLLEAAKYLMRGSHEIEDETRSRAADLADQAIRLAPDSVNILLRAVTIYSLVESSFEERFIDKHKVIKRILEIDPENVMCLQIRAMEWFTQAVGITLIEAIHLLEKARAADPTNVNVLDNLASKYREAGNREKAIQTYKNELETMSLLPRQFGDTRLYDELDIKRIQKAIAELESAKSKGKS